MTGAAVDWLPVARSLTTTFDSWLAWKHLDRALHGQGDLDAAAPRRLWPEMTEHIASLLREQSPAQWLIACDHFPDVRLIFSLSEATWPRVEEIDLSEKCSILGSPFAHVDQLLQLSLTDQHGIRRLRPGAEALAILLLYGLRRNGKLRLPSRECEPVRMGLATDPEGARAAATALVPPNCQKALLQAVDSLLEGEWSNSAGARVLAGACLNAMTNPAHAGMRLRWKLMPRCPTSIPAWNGRILDIPVDEFVQRAARDHSVFDTT